MKKIVSCTIATALATTNLTTVSADTIKSVTKIDDSINANINEEANSSVDVTIEDIEKIEGSSEEGMVTENNNDSTDLGDEVVETEGTEKETTSNNEADEMMNEGILNSEQSSELNSEASEVDSKESEQQELSKSNDSTYLQSAKRYGKLEFDMNFAMPISNTDSMKLKISKENQEIGVITDLSVEEGTFSNGATYKIETLNSKKLPLESGDNDIYFLHITIEKLELGTYSAEITAESYVDTTVENIEIMDFSKRVILGNSSNEALKYNGVFLAGDVNGDGKIDMGDYELIFENIGSSYNSKYDVNKDGKIDIADLTYVNENIGLSQGQVVIENTDAILDVNNVNVDESKFELEFGDNLKDIFLDNEKSIGIAKNDGQAPSKESPLVIDIDLSSAMRKNGVARTGNGNEAVEMEKIVLKAPENSINANAGMPEAGSITYTDE
ncbi:dockerin type I domain-containing protein, partial [Clostridium saudiense]